MGIRRFKSSARSASGGWPELRCLGSKGVKAWAEAPNPRAQARILGSIIQPPLNDWYNQPELRWGPSSSGRQGRISGSAWCWMAGQGSPGSRGPSGSSLPSGSWCFRSVSHHPGGSECHSRGIRSRKGGRRRTPSSSTAPRTGTHRRRWGRSKSTEPTAIHGVPFPESSASQAQARSSSSRAPRWPAGTSLLPWRRRAIQAGSGQGPNSVGAAKTLGPSCRRASCSNRGQRPSRPPSSQACEMAASAQAESPHRRPRSSPHGAFQSPSQAALSIRACLARQSRSPGRSLPRTADPGGHHPTATPRGRPQRPCGGHSSGRRMSGAGMGFLA